MALSDTTVRQARTTGKNYTLSDADGLLLRVTATGGKLWHFRFYWQGKQQRISFGTYPEVGLKAARRLREDARALIAQGIDPREQRREAQRIATPEAHTFHTVYHQWRDFRALSLKEGRQSTLSQIARIFKKDVLPHLGALPIHTIRRTDLLHVIQRIEQRKAHTTAEKVRTWFNQLFRYALVKHELDTNPAGDLDIVALPKPPVSHNPHLRMHELPAFLHTLRQYGNPFTRNGIRLLLLTGVRTGELRHATPDQFDLQRGLWTIPPENVKQLQLTLRKKNRQVTDIPPYIVPLSRQAIDILRHLLAHNPPSQRYLLAHRSDPRQTISENTLNAALKRMGYTDKLTGHGIRGTLSTALNELGYPKPWIEAQLSHSDKDKISAAYNHAQYIEQRRNMMQDWADRLDQWESGEGTPNVIPLHPGGLYTTHPEIDVPPIVRQA